MEAYCVKCKTKHEMDNTEEVTLKNGRNAVKGTCKTCKTKMVRIVAKDKSKEDKKQ